VIDEQPGDDCPRLDTSGFSKMALRWSWTVYVDR